ncbi:MAG: hypothetical protein MI741_21210, partial [Rhodospirillales bacterium]|nr:hypothetical protein [Rhodospirillales bacterium]
AYFQVRNQRRKMQRDRLMFDDDVLEQLATEAEAFESPTTDRLVALQECIEKLPRHHRDIIRKRYMHDTSVQALAKAIHKSANAVAVMLFRIREALVRCIESRTKSEGPS